MKYDKELFEKEFDKLMNKNTLSYNSETKEWSRKETSYTFGEMGPDEVIDLDDDRYAHLRDYTPTKAEEEIGDESTVAWGNFREKLFICLDVFLVDVEYKFFEAFEDVCRSLTKLWEVDPYDEEIQQSVFRFLDELDLERKEKIEKELWFCMYANTENWNAKADMLTTLLASEISWDFPYHGYYENEAFALIDELGEMKGEDSARLDRDYGFLVDIHYDIKKMRSLDN